MKQMTFTDAEYASQRKQARKELFLIKIDHVVPWQGLTALIEPHSEGRKWTSALSTEAMLHVHLMQT